MRKLIPAFAFLGLLSSLSAFAADTSGCGSASRSQIQGQVGITATRAPRRDCWNVPTSGVEALYRWQQVNNRESEKNNIGFWISLNGQAQYAKATRYHCEPDRRGGTGHDTSGTNYFSCEARAQFTFSQSPNLLVYAYGNNGQPNAWDVAVAVSLDDNGTWDSGKDGGNYHFRFE